MDSTTHRRIAMNARLRLAAVGLYLLFGGIAVAAEPPTDSTPMADVELDESRLRVHFIDVGAGMAVLVETPGDRMHLFIDGGDRGLDAMSDYLEQFVGDAGVDVAIVTHADQDHYLGMHRVFRDYDVGQFWYTGYTSHELSRKQRWRRLLELVDEEPDIAVYMPICEWVNAGEFEAIDDGDTPEETDDVLIQYLNVDRSPPRYGPIFGREFSESKRRNNASLVFKIIYGDISFLITGDINGRDKEHEGVEHDDEIDSEELELWVRHQLDQENYGLNATVLQAPHHGSNGSCSLRFLQTVEPEWIVIPAGHRNDHPTEDTLRRMELAGMDADHILRTDLGDTTPETRHTEPRGDDSYVFETDGQTITRL
jgi:competence protein ComEC